MQKTPKSNRLHIGIFGKRNAGKSSLINKLTNQDVSIVSEIAGTTTDAVEKSMELLPLGPVVFIDTAGIDDTGDLGIARIKKTQKILERTDIAIIVCDDKGWDEYEKQLCEEFQKLNIPIIAVINKQDIRLIEEEKLLQIKQFVKNPLTVSVNKDRDIIDKIKEQLIQVCPDDFINPPSILNGIATKNDTIVLVIPIDKEAPKGRLILPQVQVIRDILDNNCKAIICKETELAATLENLKRPPRIVITDSQAFKTVDNIVPKDIELTSFSILFAKLKGDIQEFYNGALAIDSLNDGDKILVCESCSHHQIDDDIARVKIPKLIRQKTQKNPEFVYKSGHDFMDDVENYALIIHCGACMTNRREILTRIMKCKKSQTPITNYGICIAHCIGILDRAMKPFKKLDKEE